VTGKPQSLSLGRACYGLKARGKGAAAKKLARRGERIRGFLAADKKGGSFAQGVHTDVHDRAKDPPDAVQQPFHHTPLYDAGRFALRGFLAADKKGGSFAQGVHADVHNRAKDPPDAVSGQKDLST